MLKENPATASPAAALSDEAEGCELTVKGGIRHRMCRGKNVQRLLNYRTGSQKTMLATLLQDRQKQAVAAQKTEKSLQGYLIEATSESI